MSDIKPRILEILKPLQLSKVATITTDGKPWVRYVMASCNDGMTIRFASFTGARKVEQIKNNPEVHMTCGVANPADLKPYLQIQGRAHLSVDEQDKKAFWNPSLASIFSGPEDPQYGIIIIEPYRVELCTPGSFEPEVWVV